MTNFPDLPPLLALPDTRWFNTLFEAHGWDGRVKALTSNSIGTGQIGENVRFEFEFEGEAGGAPASLVGKFPSPNDVSRATAAVSGGLGHYRRETNFYRHFKSLAGRIAPDCLYSEHDPDTENFAIIMEDMAPAMQGDQLAGCSLQQAERVIDSAAILHASHWGDTSLEGTDWLQGTDAAPETPFTPELIAGLWTGFKARYDGMVSPEAIAIGDRLTAPKNHEWVTKYSGPKCLTHGDFRLDNMLFGPSTSAKPLAIVDWQTVGLGCGAGDVSYFIGAGFTRETRAAHELPLLKRWHDALTDKGISGYSFEDAVRDYRYWSFSGFSVAFAAPMIVERTERGDAMFMTMIRRHVDQIMSHDALDLLA